MNKITTGIIGIACVVLLILIFLPQNQETITDSNNNNSKPTSSLDNNYCLDTDNEVWQKRCQAYKDTNSYLCESFSNGNPSGKDDIDECYYILSIHTEENNCIKIEDKKLRWKCEAIATKDMNQCAYSIDLESEIWCLRNYMQFYQEKEACDLIEQKEQEVKNDGLVDSEGDVKFGLSEKDCLNSLNTIEESLKRTEEETIIAVYGNNCKSEYNNQDCSTYEDESEESDCLLCQAMNNKESNKCLLIKNNRRDSCILALSLLTNDVSFCQERSDEAHIDSCIEQYGRSVNLDICLNPIKSNCIISAVESMDETNQNINSNVCSLIKNTNEQGICYVEYSKSKLQLK